MTLRITGISLFSCYFKFIARFVPSKEREVDKEQPPHLVAGRDARDTLEVEPSPSTSEDAQEDVRSPIQDVINGIGEVPSDSPSEFLQDYMDSDTLRVSGRSKRSRRGAFKERGSLVERLNAGDNIEIPSHSRAEVSPETAKKARKKSKSSKPINIDIAIPSIISVGNFARLLGVSLGI